MKGFGWLYRVFGGARAAERSNLPTAPAEPAAAGSQSPSPERADVVEDPLDAAVTSLRMLCGEDLDAAMDALLEQHGPGLDELERLAPSKAIGLLKRCDVLAPGHPSVRVRLGELYASTGDLATAQQVLQPLVADARVGGRADLALGAVAERQGDLARAATHYQCAVVAGRTLPGADAAMVRLRGQLPRSTPPLDVLLQSKLAPSGYTFEHQLGRGGAGIVYLARDERIGRSVAIKALRPTTLAQGEAIAHMLDEARRAAALAIPGVVQIIDVDVERGAIIMEHLPGGTLADRLRVGGALSPRAALQRAYALCRVLEQVHAVGITHRDIKPSNIFARPDGAVVLGDFGAAALGGDHGVAAATRRYASPEQLLGAAASPRDDLYALTLVTAEMLSGTMPPLTQQEQAAWAVSAWEPARLLGAPPWDARLLAVKQAQRPSSVQELTQFYARALLALVDGDGGRRAP